MEQIAINNDSQFNALLSDELVMQWLLNLESEHADADEASDARISTPRYHA